MQTLTPQPAPFFKILLAILYDSLMVACIVFILWQPMPLIPDAHLPLWLKQTYRLGYLFVITFSFYGWFWTHGGQTIGMRAWRIKLIDQNGNSPNWKQALIRYWVFLLTLGFGLVWSLFDHNRLSWHDRASFTRLISTQ